MAMMIGEAMIGDDSDDSYCDGDDDDYVMTIGVIVMVIVMAMMIGDREDSDDSDDDCDGYCDGDSDGY